MSTFNPKQHLINLERKGSKPARNYLPAKARIMWLRHKDSHQDVNIKFGIETELVEHERDVMVRAENWNNQSRKQEVEQVSASVVIFKATIRDDDGRILATGYKQENSYNFLDYLEKAECLDLDVELLTPNGFKRYDQLAIGEPVYGYNMEADTLELTPLQKISVYENAQRVRYFNNNGMSFTCTPNHRWATYSCQTQNGRLFQYHKFIPLNEMRTQHRVILAASANDGDIQISKREAALLGWAICDGSFPTGGFITIGQSKAYKDEIRELIGDWGTESVEYPKPRRVYQNKHTSHFLPRSLFRLPRTIVEQIYLDAQITSPDELPNELPKVVARFPYASREAMLDAMMKADASQCGDFGKKTRPYVMDVFQVLCAMQGRALSSMKVSSVGNVPIQRVRKSRHLYHQTMQSEPIENGTVWCPTNALGSWVARFPNGIVSITGNTGSIARALSVLGFGTEFALELELDLDGNRIADAPVTDSQKGQPSTTTKTTPDAQPATTQPPTNGKPSTDLPPRITTQQGKDIMKLMTEKELSRNDFMSKWGSLKVMSKELAGEVLTELMSYTAPKTTSLRQPVEIPF